MAAKEVKPSAVELLARLSGKKKLEPTVQDAIEEIEVTIPFCRLIHLEASTSRRCDFVSLGLTH